MFLLVVIPYVFLSYTAIPVLWHTLLYLCGAVIYCNYLCCLTLTLPVLSCHKLSCALSYHVFTYIFLSHTVITGTLSYLCFACNTLSLACTWLSYPAIDFGFLLLSMLFVLSCHTMLIPIALPSPVFSFSYLYVVNLIGCAFLSYHLINCYVVISSQYLCY